MSALQARENLNVKSVSPFRLRASDPSCWTLYSTKHLNFHALEPSQIIYGDDVA
jgi:hypothetical protein